MNSTQHDAHGKTWAAAGDTKDCVPGSIVHHKRAARQAPNANLAHGLRYAIDLGWRVVPVDGKKPAGGLSYSDASSDPEEIGALFAAADRVTGCGARMGGALRLVAPEIDHKNGGTVETFYKLAGVRMGDYKTPTMRTGDGWRMICYVPSADDCDFGNLELDNHGIAILGNGGQVVLPPSIHPNGKRYQWVPGLEPWSVDVAPVPALLLDRIRAKTSHKAQAAERAAHGAQPGVYDLQDLRAMLAVLQPWQDGYSWWLSIMMACHAGFGDDALPIVEDWADGKPGEVARKWADFDAAGGVTVATLVYHARAAGWVPPVPDSDIPERWRITADDWRTCPLCAAHHTARMDDNSASDYHRWCRKPSCKVYRKRKIHVALRCVFSWRGVGTETVPAAQFRTWRRRANLRYGSNGWRAIPDGDTHLALFDTETPTEALDDVLERALALMLANDATRRERRKARKFLLTLPADEALDPVTLERMKEALDLLAIGKPVNLSTPRKARSTDGAALELPVKPPRPKPVETILVSKHYHSRAVKDVLTRLSIPFQRRPYGGWRTEPLSDMQWMQLKTALAFAVPGAMVTAALDVGSYALLGQSWPDDLPHSEREAVQYALRNRVNLEQTLPLRR
jgi:hypothetical protein